MKTENKNIEISEQQLDNILQIISFSKNSGFRNSKEVHKKCNRLDEFNSFYMYFIKNIMVSHKSNNLYYRCVICISKKKPDTMFLYVILKQSKYYFNMNISVYDVIKYNSDKQKFDLILKESIHILIDSIIKRLNYDALDNDIHNLCNQFKSDNNNNSNSNNLIKKFDNGNI